MQDICRESVGPLERTEGSTTRSYVSRGVAFFSESFFIFYEFMMMPMIIFGRYYSIYVILHLATANYCQMSSIKRPYLRGKQTRHAAACGILA